MKPIGRDKNKFIMLEGVSKSYTFDGIATEILNEASLAIHEYEFVMVMGPSGCGKTTVLNLIGTLDTAYTGIIEVDGQVLTGLTNDALTRYRREKIGFVFQFFNLLPTLTVEENVRAGLEILPLSREEIKTRTSEMLDDMGLLGKAGKFPSQLSGGEQQRVAIARALAKKPRILLADEPTGNLDERNAEKTMDLLKKINQESDITIVLVTHNVAFRTYADRIVELHNKQTVSSILNAPYISG